MPVPDIISRLIETFDRNSETYRSGSYNETQLRREFIDPFFTALGWDVANTDGYAEAYKDVIHEDAIRIGADHAAPDYCFRIGGTRKFFVETKKPSVDIKMDTGPAFQVRRYAWSAKLPLSIVTDFEEFAVYDCRVKPDKNDPASKARTIYIKYDHYADRWDEIAGVFSRDAILKGSFDKYVVSTRKKRGTAEVDDAFLAEIEKWRDALARNIALRNPGLSQRQLNYAVQVTIDRIIFLRICEDRGIEPYQRLRAQTNGTQVYQRLFTLFQRADDRYNSGLFHFHPEKDRAEGPDELTPALEIDDKVLKDILKSLYYPDCPYEFSVLPADILGQVYEQFLGKVITLTSGHRAKVEDKPEVKKAGGVYYTPTYIVEYIVEHTVGKLLADRSVEITQISRGRGKKRHQAPVMDQPIHVLDPACGSGSFLIVAYQKLLDWYLQYYLDNNPQKWAKLDLPPISQSRSQRAAPVSKRLSSDTDGDDETPKSNETGATPLAQPEGCSADSWQLTTPERKRILLDHIYGVDIDTQAVEVTKLSLLLKVLENETRASLDNQLRLFHERALPDLSQNIKCGNSLIAPDFYAHHQTELFDDEQQFRINAFDWQAEFKSIMSAGGFDTAIGNPPYIRIQTMRDTAPASIDYYKKRYAAAAKGNYDIYVLFVERGLGLLNEAGRLGLILPHKFFNAQYGRSLRQLCAEGRHLEHVVNFTDEQVFDGATTYTCLLFLTNRPNDAVDYMRVEDLDQWRSEDDTPRADVPAERFTPDDWNITIGPGAELIERLSNIPITLGDVAAKLFQGLVTSADSVFLLDLLGPEVDGYVRVRSNATGAEYYLEAMVVHPLCKGSLDVKRYTAIATKRVLFPYDPKVSSETGRSTLISPDTFRQEYPNAWSYLLENAKVLRNRERGKMNHDGWYGYVYPKSIALFAKPKILTPSIASRASYAYDKRGEVYFVGSGGGGGGGYGIILHDDCGLDYCYILGLLNSSVLDFVLKKIASTFRGGYYAYNRQYIEQLPIRTINFDNPQDKAQYDRMVSLVQSMLDLHQQLTGTKTAHDKTVIQRQIDATDRQIDQLVYQLYQLTPEEIKIVEEATTSAR